MYGRAEVLASEPARAMEEAESMVGVGICPEGIEQNPAVYELMNEWAFRYIPQDLQPHKGFIKCPSYFKLTKKRGG